MSYRNKIIAELTQLENYARICFAKHFQLHNGYGRSVNGFIDKFMTDITNGNIDLPNIPGKKIKICQVSLDMCFNKLLPQCCDAKNISDTILFLITKVWAEENLVQCFHCGEWFIPDPDEWPNDVCPECAEECND